MIKNCLIIKHFGCLGVAFKTFSKRNLIFLFWEKFDMPVSKVNISGDVKLCAKSDKQKLV